MYVIVLSARRVWHQLQLRSNVTLCSYWWRSSKTFINVTLFTYVGIRKSCLRSCVIADAIRKHAPPTSCNQNIWCHAFTRHRHKHSSSSSQTLHFVLKYNISYILQIDSIHTQSTTGPCRHVTVTSITRHEMFLDSSVYSNYYVTGFYCFPGTTHGNRMRTFWIHSLCMHLKTGTCTCIS